MLSFDNGAAMLAPIAVALPIVMACVCSWRVASCPALAVDLIAIATALGLGGLLGYLLAAVGGWSHRELGCRMDSPPRLQRRHRVRHRSAGRRASRCWPAA